MKKFIVMIVLLILCYHVHSESTKYPKIMLNVNEHVHPLPNNIFAIIDDMWNSKTDDMEGKLLECEDLNSVLSLNLVRTRNDRNRAPDFAAFPVE